MPNIYETYGKRSNEWVYTVKAIGLNVAMDGSVSIRGASRLVCVPFTALQTEVISARFVSVGF
jgi:hypothetical protein